MSDVTDLRHAIAEMIDELRADGEFASPSMLEDLLIQHPASAPTPETITVDVPLEFAQVFANNWFDGRLWVQARRAMGDALVAAGLPLTPPAGGES